MLGWALATFVNGLKIRLAQELLVILAEREVPQRRNLPVVWWIYDWIMMDMGFAVYNVVCVIKSLWMREYALHF